MKSLFYNSKIQILFLIVLIIIFWHPIMFENEFFYDDWSFIDTFKAGTPSIGYFLKPHNEHFMPMFKLVFFGMYKLFKTNIIPYMGLSIAGHVINCLVLFFLLRLIFLKNQRMPFFLALFFALNVSYFEVLHWFVNFSQQLTMFFFLVTLIALHLAHKNGHKKLYWLSVIASFFIPMNFSLGFLGIIFIAAYYYLVLHEKPVTEPRCKIGASCCGFHSWGFLMPYFLAWFSYLIIFLIFTIPSLMNRPTTAPPLTFDAAKLVFFFVLGLTGLLIRTLGYSILVFPYTTGFAALLTVFFLIFVSIYFLYFVLNPKRSRIPVISGSGAALFSIIGIFLCYAMLALGRASLEPISFIGWGRYHYIPMFFLTILLGAVIPQFVKIFSLISSEGRLKIFLLIVFVIFLATHFVLIRQKSYSPVRTEGSLSNPTADRNTNVNNSAATARA